MSRALYGTADKALSRQILYSQFCTVQICTVPWLRPLVCASS